MDQILLKEIPVEKGYPIAHLLRVSNVEIKDTKNGKKFIQLELGDSSTTLKWNKKWNSSQEEYNKYKNSKVLFITGKTDIYDGKIVIICDSLAVPEEDAELELLKDLLPCTPYDISFLKKELWMHIKNIKNDYIKELCFLIVKDPEVKEKLSKSVCALNIHHNYIGGLLTHIFRLIALVISVADSYNNNPYPNSNYKVNKDILIFLCLCHDLQKISEYDEMQYCDYGNLIPHLPAGAIHANRLMDKIEDFPEELRTQLTHGLLSHHGQVKWGSPVTPCTVEAVLFHYCDNMSAKVDSMLEALDNLPDGESWTEYLKGIGKKAYMGGMLID